MGRAGSGGQQIADYSPRHANEALLRDENHTSEEKVKPISLFGAFYVMLIIDVHIHIFNLIL